MLIGTGMVLTTFYSVSKIGVLWRTGISAVGSITTLQLEAVRSEAMA